jgi:hypothetical protein
MQAAIGADPACDAALEAIFGSLDHAPQRLAEFLQLLGVATHPAAYGLASAEWIRIVDDAFDGARGRNFIGSRTRFPSFDFEPLLLKEPS